jgi:hypothetical protein
MSSRHFVLGHVFMPSVLATPPAPSFQFWNTPKTKTFKNSLLSKSCPDGAEVKRGLCLAQCGLLVSGKHGGGGRGALLQTLAHM